MVLDEFRLIPRALYSAQLRFGVHHTCEIDLPLQKPLEDVQFIMHYDCAAVGRPRRRQPSPIRSHPKCTGFCSRTRPPSPNWDSDCLPLKICVNILLRFESGVWDHFFSYSRAHGDPREPVAESWGAILRWGNFC